MRNIHWFPIYVHLSRLTHLSKSRSLMAVTLDVSKRPICFVSRGPLCHWNESDYQLLNINSNLLIIGDRWFSSFNKSERVKIAHYLVRNLAGSWSQDKKKHCPFAPLRLPNPPHSTSLKKHVVAIDFYIPAQKHTHIKTFVSLITVFIDKFNFQRFVLHAIYSYFYFSNSSQNLQNMRQNSETWIKGFRRPMWYQWLHKRSWAREKNQKLAISQLFKR